MSRKRLSDALSASKDLETVVITDSADIQHPHQLQDEFLNNPTTKYYQSEPNLHQDSSGEPRASVTRCRSLPTTRVPKANIINKTGTALERWGIYSMAYKQGDGDELAVGFGSGAISLYNARSGKIIREMVPGYMHGFATMALVYTKDKRHIISTSAGGNVSLWKAYESKHEPALAVYEEKNEVNALDICKDGSFFATAGKDRCVRVYDVKNFERCSMSRIPDFETMDDADRLMGHTKRVFAVRFHPQENNIFLTGGWDNCVKIWDKRVMRAARKSLSGPHICGKSIDVTGNTILTGSWTAKNALQLWDMRMGRVTTSLPYIRHNVYHGDFIYCAKFANSTTVLAGGSGTNGVCTINVATETVKSEIDLDKPCYAIDSCSEGKVAVIGGLCNNIVQARI